MTFGWPRHVSSRVQAFTISMWVASDVCDPTDPTPSIFGYIYSHNQIDGSQGEGPPARPAALPPARFLRPSSDGRQAGPAETRCRRPLLPPSCVCAAPACLP
eukprot:SAG22_NODE_2592_length_2407_cov_1.497834_3_plen_102_part_00